MAVTLKDLVNENKQLNTNKRLCYSCKHRGEVTGSSHSCCNALPNKAGQLVLLANLSDCVSNPSFISLSDNEGNKIPVMEVDTHGIKKGWFIYPINFDPCWLKYCLMYDNGQQ
jgi:hypothetical protein